MRRLTKKRLQEMLTASLKLRDPEFRLRKVGATLVGSIISETFRGQGDLKRQNSIRDALDLHLGGDSGRLVGTLLAYTPDEWYVDFEAVPAARARKAG